MSSTVRINRPATIRFKIYDVNGVSNPPENQDETKDTSQLDQQTLDDSTKQSLEGLSQFHEVPKRSLSFNNQGHDIPKEITNLLHSLPFFAGYDESNGFIEKITKALSLKKIQAGDVVITQGETARAMFFIIKGTLKVISDDGEIDLAELESGTYFGEIGIILDIKRTATVVAKSACTLLTLTAEKVSLELEAYPEIHKSVQERALTRLKSLAKQYERSGKKLPNDISIHLEGIDQSDTSRDTFVDDDIMPKLQKIDFTISVSQLASESLDVDEYQSNDDEDDYEPPPSFNDQVKPLNSASLLSKTLGEKRRASVAVWSDAKLMQFAQNLTKHSATVKENHRLNLFSAGSSLNSLHSTMMQSQRDLNREMRKDLLGLGANEFGKIAAYLDLTSLLTLRSVNKFFSNLMFQTDLALLANQNLTPFIKKINDANLARLLQLIGKHAVDLSLKNCWSITDVGIGSLSLFCHKLYSLDLSSVWEMTDNGLLKIAQVASHLNSINLSNCRKITDFGVGSILNAAPHLSEIQLSYCKNLTGKLLNHPIWGNMKRINFQRATNIRDDGFIHWKTINSDFFFLLRDINLSDCSFLTDAAIEALTLKTPQLIRLSLSFCCSLTEMFSTYLVQGCPYLELLDCSYCGAAVTEKSVSDIAQGLPKLHSLGLRGCVGLNDAGMESLAAFAKSLENINITQCKNVSVNICQILGKSWKCFTTPIYCQVE